MSYGSRPPRVLYSFPHRIGEGRICYTAWEQVRGLHAAGVDVVVHAGSVSRPLPAGMETAPTLARGRLRLPYRVLGQLQALVLHDRIVASRLPKLAERIDLIHTWPLGALETLRAARRLGIPTVLERPNAHTRLAYELVRAECERLGVELPADHEHAYNEVILEREEREYELADFLLCPSDFVAASFRERGHRDEKLLRHIYGYDEATFHAQERSGDADGLTMLFVGVAAVRKGLHFALEAWLASPASDRGTFLVAGEVLPAYGRLLASELSHPSVRVLGHRDDVAELMRQSDVLVLPTLEEGFALVCTEAIGSGCVPLVSDACTDLCRHDENALVHRVGDVATLERHITAVDADRDLLARLRAGCAASAPNVTWTAAGARLLEVYRDALSSHAPGEPRPVAAIPA